MAYDIEDSKSDSPFDVQKLSLFLVARQNVVQMSYCTMVTALTHNHSTFGQMVKYLL